MEIEFTWDPVKAKHNLKKHRVSFEVAKQVFFDPFALIIEDCEVGDETRYLAIGHAGSGPLLVAVFVDRSDEGREVIRIISAREADQYEHRAYADQFEEGH
jgi:uncharacterized DUF497 family protein